jgi:hypothetical protein
MKYFLKTLIHHVGRGFFATYAAGAKHRHFFVFGFIEVLSDVLRKLSKSRGLGVDRAFKGEL